MTEVGQMFKLRSCVCNPSPSLGRVALSPVPSAQLSALGSSPCGRHRCGCLHGCLPPCTTPQRELWSQPQPRAALVQLRSCGCVVVDWVVTAALHQLLAVKKGSAALHSVVSATSDLFTRRRVRAPWAALAAAAGTSAVAGHEGSTSGLLRRTRRVQSSPRARKMGGCRAVRSDL